MTHFEYIAVAVSIVLSFTILRLLDALPGAFDAKKRYWPHTIWIVFLLYLCATFWWLFWFHKDVGEITFPYFLWLMAPPVTLYLVSTALVTATPTAVDSWRAHFVAVRRRFFAGATVYLLLLVATSTFTFGIPLAHPLRVFQVLALIAFAAGARFESDAAQLRISGIALAVILAALALAIAGTLPFRLT